jgi:hypothetical protein
MPDEMGATAVAEPVESVETAEPVETGAETAETGTSAEEVSNADGSQPEKSELTEKTPAKGKLNLAEVAKMSKEALAAINPVLPAAIQKAAMELRDLYREFPGGLKEARELRTTFQQFGGAEGVKEIQQAVSEYGQLEQEFEKGDPAFMTKLADAAPASFSQVMPAGLEKWKAIDKDGFEHTMARVLVDTLKPHNVQETLASIWNAIDPEKGKTVRDDLARLWNIFEGIKATSEKVPERKTNPQEEALSQREQQLVQREIQLNLKPVATEGRAQIQGIVDREMGQNYQWDKTDSDVKQALSEAVRKAVVDASQKDRTFSAEFDRLQARGDWGGLSRHVKNFQERVTPSLLPKIARLFNVKPKGAAVVPAKKPVASADGAKPDQGWVQVSQMPKASQINMAAMGRNYEDMILSNKAILKDGRKVTWP